MSVSICERMYIREGVSAGVRADGRGRRDVRPASFETGVVAQASGSCRATTGAGSHVLVGVKVAVGAPEGVTGLGPSAGDRDLDDGPDGLGNGGAEDGDAAVMHAEDPRLKRGRVVVSVECAPAIIYSMDPRAVEDLCVEYAEFIAKLLNGDHGGLDLESLCIVPANTCWVIHVDALVLGYGGNLLDTIFQATRGALHNTLIPKFSIEESVNSATGNTSYEFDVADEETEELKGHHQVPVIVTLFKIGNYYVLDPSPLEEKCSDVQLTVAINRKGLPCSIHKIGAGSIEPSLLAAMIQDAKEQGLALFRELDHTFARAE
ncbi:ribosomal protein S5 domain 2-type protein [Chytriomyces sp. MP71]|nr:ribosomal protein S5 domain 2-type protein [Chytriomyces sp. MP71]